MALWLAVGLCVGSGFALVTLWWSRRGSFAEDILLRVFLSAGFGLGIFSVVYLFARIFFAEILATRNLLLADVIMFAVLAAAAVVRSRFRLVKFGFPALTDDDGWPAWLERTLRAALVIVFLIAAYAAVMHMLVFPHGDGWDAFAIWNLHARFLFLGGEHWRDGFTSLVGGSHPDYPLLLPAAIAHFWAFLGHDDPRVPAVIGFVFSFATVGVLFAALSILRGRVAAMMAAVALLSTPFFIEQGTAQYADVPLSFYFLAAIVLLSLFDGATIDGATVDGATTNATTTDSAPTGSSNTQPWGLPILAGLATGFAAWTKNEGLLFLFAVVVSRVLVLVRRARTQNLRKRGDRLIPVAIWLDIPALLAGLAPGLFLILYYKHWIAIPGDLFSDPATAVPKLLDPARYWAIFTGSVKGFFRFGHWFLVPATVVLAGIALVFGKDGRFTRQPGFVTGVFALTLTFIGYFGVFLITPYDIHWHLRFSLMRLFLQLWPSVVFLVFLALRNPTAAKKAAI
jgi:hypothetical protein